jgi:hypothetical protein
MKVSGKDVLNSIYIPTLDNVQAFSPVTCAGVAHGRHFHHSFAFAPAIGMGDCSIKQPSKNLAMPL